MGKVKFAERIRYVMMGFDSLSCVVEVLMSSQNSSRERSVVESEGSIFASFG